MKKIALAVLANFSLLFAFSQTQTTSKFNPKALWDLQFYPHAANDIRSANGSPGAKYWQNRADYKLAVVLDANQHTISGDVEITYTNNSPDNLNYLWLYLEQNIYRADSRSAATAAGTGGRYAAGMFTQGNIIKAVSVEIEGKKTTPQYTT
ncbi:MAG TPA: hypothetical protein VM871_07065, partial [Flavisolibacter sp.]|nr:hypothetical protein [Flavisolibacter sp.]